MLGSEDALPSPAVPAAPAAQHGLPEITPDRIEQEENDQIDDAVPTHGYGQMRVVGLGGSAGGLTALQAFFGALPPRSGMAFVVILHLAPEHESHLAEVIGRTTSMPVLQVTGRVKVEIDHVYVIPPGKQLSLDDGHLILGDLEARTGKHVAVDLFFRALADTHGPHAAAIVLSGADGDGANGIKRIKERGGLCVAQAPDEAEHGSMPRAAIATGLVDWVLPVAEMPVKLLNYWRAESRLHLPPESSPPPAEAGTGEESPSKVDAEKALQETLSYLRARAGHDFSCYKRATVLRRIGRRMQVNGIEDLPSYLAFIRTHPAEPVALLQDLLISVTNFFRDRDAFAALESELPRLFRNKGPEDTVRVWVAACATGEEAYSVAMLLREHADTLSHPPKLQVFATDLDDSAIQWAREGEYSEAIAADVSEERLRRFFSREHGQYKVKRETREIVLFALHDLLKDSPFSKLDLVTCRNLFIYLNPQAQARVLEIFHFALQPEGLLFLGSSETVDESSVLFGVADKKRRIYTRRATVRAGLPTFTEPSTLSRVVRKRPSERSTGLARTLHAASPDTMQGGSARMPNEDAAPGDDRVPWAQRHYDFIEDLAPPSIIVNEGYEIMHLSEHAGRFLQVDGGNPTMNLLRVVHSMLRIELRAALYQAAQSGSTVETHGIPVEFERGARVMTLRVTPARTSPPDSFLIVFQEQEAAAGALSSANAVSAESESVIRHLEEENERLKAHLRHTIEESEASKEEHKASTEELQAMNEELRSASEELETSREELQSINEELSTVNQELKSNVDELSRSNSDLQNLMAATQIATVFLDRDLSIQRYTPPAVALFNIIPTDAGRPLSDLTSRLDYPGLAADAAQVLEQLIPVELEVAHRDGRYFLARTLPYRTGEDRISGVVTTFVDITRRRQAEEELRASETRFRAVADLVPDLLYSTDAAGQLLWCNRRWLTFTGQTALQAQGYGWVDAIHPEDRARARQSFLAAIEAGTPFLSEHRLLGRDGSARWFLVRAEPLRDEGGQVVQWFGAKTDIEDFKAATADLEASQERLRLILENAREFAIYAIDLERRVSSWNPGAERIIGFTEGEIIGQSSDVVFTPEDRAHGRPEEEIREALSNGRAMDERWHQRKDGERFWANGALMRMNRADGQPVGFVKIMRDETEALRTRQALERSREELITALKETEAARAEAEAAGKAKDHFLAVLSHELRTPLMPVTMAVHLLGRDPSLSTQAREALDMIERNVRIESHFIDDLLDITKIARGKLEILREPTDVHRAVRHAVEVTTSDIEGKGQRITVELKAKKHELSGDATRLQQLFWNLLRNASKFTPDGGAIHISSRNARGVIIVEVSDTGVGFEADAATRIFEAFEQASAEVTREFGGLGLGLAISKATVDAHGGSLRAQSKGRGQGATFTVELPLAK